MASTPTLVNNEAAILSWVIRPRESHLSLAAARAILRFQFGESDHARMHELAVKNQQGEITEQEQAELQSYLHVGLVLDMHIIAEKHGGKTIQSNLALSCFYDNSFRGPNIAGATKPVSD